MNSIQLFKPYIRKEAIDAVSEVLKSGWIGLGPKTAEFEKAFADYTGAPYCVGLNSCTSALHLALRLLDLPKGAEVITTPVTFVSTNHAILYEGLTPVFADVDPYTANIDVDSIESRITPRTGAIMLVHYGGYPCDLDEIYALASKHGIRVVEDCAHACGASYKGTPVGSYGDLHAFSFHAVKNLPMGDGGALTVRSSEHDERLRRLRWLGIDKSTFQRSQGSGYSWEYDVTEVGFKYHMNDIQAAIGLEQLKFLDEDNRRRAEIISIYRSELSNVPGLKLPQWSDDRISSNLMFWALVDEREKLIDKLAENGVGLGVHYKRNDAYTTYSICDLPNAEYFSTHEVTIPLHLGLSDDDIFRVTRLIKEGW